MVPAAALVERFRTDLDALSAPGERIGVAVSGGPDSLALLLLAAAARPGQVEAATVDHALRAESAAEAEMVAAVCGRLSVPHEIITHEWEEPPTAAIQERAREARYDALAWWAGHRGLAALVTAHHADDQAETLVMRLNRGAGVRGLAAMRPCSKVPGSKLALLRPLLEWRRSELEEVCKAAGLTPAIDPSNSDEHYERVRLRQALAAASWLNPDAIARSAMHLASADDALDWVAEGLALARITDDSDGLQIDADGLPVELQRRLLLVVFARFHAPEPRGPNLVRALTALSEGRTVTLSGLKLTGGRRWRASNEPERKTSKKVRSGPVADSTCG
jgi:tRNA(Ile)-lysidine synthase